MSSNDILEGLNPPQLQAVTTTEGPVLVLAGAGSGKTRVLTRRIAYLLDQGKTTRSGILAVTFTNKAAREMKERIEALCGPGRFPNLGTFHSVCSRWLRREGEILGLSPRFTIYDTSEQLLVMKQVVRQDLKLDDKKWRPRYFLSWVSRWKNQYIKVPQALDMARDPVTRNVAAAYECYQKRLEQNQAVDFDDLLFKTVDLFMADPDLLAAYRRRIDYILIDEYQDVNNVQYELVKLLAGEHRNLCCVGDDDQSIYRFRGVDVTILLRFEEDFPEAVVIKLEQNYRSTSYILQAANAVVAHNVGRKAKALWTDQGQGEKLTYHCAADGREEARYVARKLLELCRDGTRSLGDCVVLYRTNAQSRLLEEAMIQAGIPYRVVGGVRFFDRKEIKDIICYLRVLQNPADNLSLLRIINVPPRGVGAASLKRLAEFARREGVSLFDGVRRGDEIALPSKAAKSLRELVTWVEELRTRIVAGDPDLHITSIVQQILDKSGYRKALEAENTVEAQARLDNLEEFINVAADFDRDAEERTLEAFLAEMSLLTDQDTYEESGSSVTLMTLHAAKGLEFPVVFLVGLEEGIFPHSRALEETDDAQAALEEERAEAHR